MNPNMETDMQSDMSNLCLQKHFIKKGHIQKYALLFIFSSEFEAALFTMAGQICLK